MSQRLPSADSAWVEETKIKEYLLNARHPVGGSKARFFLSCGFDLQDWQKFQEALLAQGRNNAIVSVTEDRFGTRYVVECHCPTPDQSNPCIRSVWETRKKGDNPRLITAHPIAQPA